LWALEWVWHPAETNLRCAGSPRIFIPNPNILALIVSEISTFIRTDAHGCNDSIIIILIKNIYTLWGQIYFLLPVLSDLPNDFFSACPLISCLTLVPVQRLNVTIHLAPNVPPVERAGERPPGGSFATLRFL